jgi:hypothetical protein
LNEQYGRIIAHYSVRTLVDVIKPDRFEHFKTKVREIWPYTFLHVALPFGQGVPKRHRVPRSLLPAPLPTRKDKAGSGAVAGDSEPGDLALPAEPAPALDSSPGSAVETVAAPAETPVSSSEAPVPSKPETKPRSAAAFTDPTSTALQPRGRRRRRRSRWKWQKPLQITFFAIVALLIVLVLIIANLRKG